MQFGLENIENKQSTHALARGINRNGPMPLRAITTVLDVEKRSVRNVGGREQVRRAFDMMLARWLYQTPWRVRHTRD